MLRLLTVVLFIAAVAASPIPRRDVSLPDFAERYAPIYHFHRDEQWYPAELDAHLKHTKPELDDWKFSVQAPLSLDNLNQVIGFAGPEVCLASKEGITTMPSWFQGTKPRRMRCPYMYEGTTGIIVVVPKPEVKPGTIDVFYFHFFAFSKGHEVSTPSGQFPGFWNRAGVWEHTMIRFLDGKPRVMWFSKHEAGGEAVIFKALEKRGDRPVVYVGNGTHANWPTSGQHDFTVRNMTLPDNGTMIDTTELGYAYDPLHCSWSYDYNATAKVFTPHVSATPVDWLYYQGRWGDHELPKSHTLQGDRFGHKIYSSGSRGPITRSLDRREICEPGVMPICLTRLKLTP